LYYLPSPPSPSRTTILSAFLRLDIYASLSSPSSFLLPIPTLLAEDIAQRLDLIAAAAAAAASERKQSVGEKKASTEPGNGPDGRHVFGYLKIFTTVN
jgi:hypothetical protein